MTVETSRHDILSIQMLRGIAALMVVFVHLDVQLRRLNLGSIDSGWMASGVDIFFVISGFIMWVTTVRRPQITAAEFMRNRIVRIVPLYWTISLLVLATSLLAPSLLHTTVFDGPHVIASFLFFPARHPITGDFWPLLVPGWTLNFEMLFYALFALAIAWSGGSAKVRLAWLVGFIGSVLWVAEMTKAEIDFMNFYADPIMLEFIAGALLGVAYASGRVPVSSLWLAAIPLGFFLLWKPGVLLPGVPHTAILAATVTVAGALFSRNIKVPFLPALGDASYSLYLTHVITLAGVAALWTHQSLLGGPFLFGATCTFAAIAVAMLCYRFVERPWLAVLKPSRAGRPSVPAPDAAKARQAAIANSTSEAAE